MSGRVPTHNANQVKCMFAGITMRELGSDEFVRIKRNQPQYTLTMSVDGKGVREQNADNSAQIEVVLLETSPINGLLSAALATDVASGNGSGIGTLQVIDLNSQAELHFAAQAWIKAPPEVTYKRGVAERVWVFETDNLSSVHSGH